MKPLPALGGTWEPFWDVAAPSPVSLAFLFKTSPHVYLRPPFSHLGRWFGADVVKVERPGVGDATRGQLRDVQAQGRFQPGQKGFCSILLYLFWVSILCELILFSRFMNARYNTWSKLQTHYLFDGSQTNAFHNLWPDDLKNLCDTLIAGTLMIPNLQIMNKEVGYFDPSMLSNPFLHFWSLGVEE